MLTPDRGSLLLALTFFVPAGASAVSHPCAALPEPGARLACYDREFPPLEAAASALPPTSEAQLKQQFGLNERELELRKPESERSPQIERIDAVVREVVTLRGGQRELLFDNGQSWRVTEGGQRGPLKEGDAVSIRRTPFGSYLLSTPGGVGLRVRRVR